MSDPISETTDDFPTSSSEVLDVIVNAERHRKFVWTAGRVLREQALWTRMEALPYSERKRVLKRLIALLEVLETQGVLQRRRDVQSIGYGNEIGFDYLGSAKK